MAQVAGSASHCKSPKQLDRTGHQGGRTKTRLAVLCRVTITSGIPRAGDTEETMSSIWDNFAHVGFFPRRTRPGTSRIPGAKDAVHYSTDKKEKIGMRAYPHPAAADTALLPCVLMWHGNGEVSLSEPVVTTRAVIGSNMATRPAFCPAYIADCFRLRYVRAPVPLGWLQPYCLRFSRLRMEHRRAKLYGRFKRC